MAEEPTPTTSDTDPAGTEPDLQAELDKWKAMSRKHETAAKQNADAAKRLAELEEKDKTEQQKLADKASEAERKAAEADVRALRLEVALDKGLPAALAKRLSGSTKEEMEADADELLTLVKSDTDKPKPPPTQKPQVKAGQNGSEDDKPNSNESINDWIRSQAQRG